MLLACVVFAKLGYCMPLASVAITQGIRRKCERHVRPHALYLQASGSRSRTLPTFRLMTCSRNRSELGSP